MKNKCFISLLFCLSAGNYVAPMHALPGSDTFKSVLNSANSFFSELGADASKIHDNLKIDNTVKLISATFACKKFSEWVKNTLPAISNTYLKSDLIKKLTDKSISAYFEEYVTSGIPKDSLVTKIAGATLELAPNLKSNWEFLKQNPNMFFNNFAGGLFSAYLSSSLTKKIEKLVPKTDNYTLDKIRWIALKVVLPVTLNTYVIEKVKNYCVEQLNNLADNSTDKKDQDNYKNAAKAGGFFAQFLPSVNFPF